MGPLRAPDPGAEAPRCVILAVVPGVFVDAVDRADLDAALIDAVTAEAGDDPGHLACPYASAGQHPGRAPVRHVVQSSVGSKRAGFSETGLECAPPGGKRAPHTLEEIGQRLGLSRDRIRQIESDALASLRELAMKQRMCPPWREEESA